MSFDGGGIRGALTTALLKRLHGFFPELFNTADLFAGTSTGSFIALGLASGLPVERIAGLYSEQNGKYIFTPRNFELFRPKYDRDHLKEKLQSVFPADLRLKDLKRPVLVPAFRVTADGMGSWGPVFFSNFPYASTRDERVLDVALASSAAPVYFPSYRHFIDGGVVANNPGTAAIALARDKNAGNQELADVYLLSVGTGFSPLYISADTSDWGALEWALYPFPPLPLISVMFDGAAEADVQFGARLLGGQYHRLNPVLSQPVALDDYKKIPYLINVAENYNLDPVINWLKSNWF
ncbi:patatin-like phospholipase family protein [Desulfotomaculum copahuensis]|uniref:patatin-like phospholipase family protein n=1 Tax=Desulfotomaculum copahuensis TaxID=1838280 RepID=UPI00249F6165|nr:patatin-like phospholipase family protein [Desulfotomaculum copahuensis]